jgi:antitoxin MazE
MLTKIQKWGNSQGVRFPRKLLEQAQIGVDDEVEVTVENGRLIVSPSQRIRGRYRLEDLVARMPAGWTAEEAESLEEDWGEPVGREVW